MLILSPVSIHNLRTVALRGAFSSTGLSFMVAPLVPEFESHFVPHVPWLKNLPLYSVRGTLQYVAAPLLMPARGSSFRWLLDRVWAAHISTHMYVILSTYTSHVCRGVLAFIIYVP